jgi:hypothetical protein
MSKHLVPDAQAQAIATAIIRAVGADPSQIEVGTVTVEWEAGDDAVVRWVGRAPLSRQTLAAILEQTP